MTFLWLCQPIFAGEIIAWGNNCYGQCDAPSGNNFVAIAGGGYHSLALKSDGSIVAWGNNTYGQSDAPTGNNFVAIAGVGYHSLALRSQRSNAVSDLSKYQQFDISVGKDVVAIARGVYRGIAFIGEPVVLLVLGLAAVVLFWKRQKVENLPEKHRQTVP